MTISIPDIRGICHRPYPQSDRAQSAIKFLKENNGDQYGELMLALATDGPVAADTVMKERGWTPLTVLHPDAGNWHKDCTLIFYACWGNSIVLDGELEVRLYDYFTERDPRCVHSICGGGTMLHAWTHGTIDNNYHLAIFQDLLDRQVNPLAVNSKGDTVLAYIDGNVEWMRKRQGEKRIMGWLERYELARTWLVEKIIERTHGAAERKWQMNVSEPRPGFELSL